MGGGTAATFAAGAVGGAFGGAGRATAGGAPAGIFGADAIGGNFGGGAATAGGGAGTILGAGAMGGVGGVEGAVAGALRGGAGGSACLTAGDATSAPAVRAVVGEGALTLGAAAGRGLGLIKPGGAASSTGAPHCSQ